MGLYEDRNERKYECAYLHTTGTVIHGRGIGKHVGTPTANMEIAKNTFLPKTGVYVADILLSDNRYYGVTHIGARPTLDNDDSVSIETHIFDFDRDIV